MIGSQLAARQWLRCRGIGRASAVVVTNGFDAIRMRGLAGERLRIVVLSDQLVEHTRGLGDTLARMRELGAEQLDPSWTPHGPDDAPVLQLRTTREPA